MHDLTARVRVAPDAAREEILDALRQTGGVVDRAAPLLGTSRATLWRSIRTLGLQGDVDELRPPTRARARIEK